jgi:hypothetical protein
VAEIPEHEVVEANKDGWAWICWIGRLARSARCRRRRWARCSRRVSALGV